MCSLGLGAVAEPALAGIIEGALGKAFSLSSTVEHIIGFTLGLSIVVFLHMSEAAAHPHNVERQTFLDVDGAVQPAPAPRFSRTSPELTQPPAHAGQHTREVLSAWGVSDDRIATLLDSGAVKQAG